MGAGMVWGWGVECIYKRMHSLNRAAEVLLLGAPLQQGCAANCTEYSSNCSELCSVVSFGPCLAECTDPTGHCTFGEFIIIIIVVVMMMMIIIIMVGFSKLKSKHLKNPNKCDYFGHYVVNSSQLGHQMAPLAFIQNLVIRSELQYVKSFTWSKTLTKFYPKETLK